MNQKEALVFVERHGIVFQAAHGDLPNLAETIAGGPIRGSWWGHPKAHQIFRVIKGVSESPDVLVCKLIDGKITYVHRRLWPALTKLSARMGERRLAKVWDEHTDSGTHQLRQESFPDWVPPEVMKQAKALSKEEAENILLPWRALLNIA